MENFILSAFGDEIDPSLDTQMRVLASHGIAHIELRAADGIPVWDITPDLAREMKGRLDAQGFKISALGSPTGKIGIHEDFDKHLSGFENLLKLAEIFDTKYIRVFSFFMPEGDDPAVHRDEVLRRLSALVKRAQETGVILLHENEKDIYGDIPERCLDILQTINSPHLRATFDPANFIQCKAWPYPHGFDLLKDYIVYVHIKDANMEGGNVVPAGYGDGRVEDMLAGLVRMNYKGFLCIEPHLGLFPGLEKLQKYLDLNKIGQGGAESFAVAADALKVILAQLQA